MFMGSCEKASKKRVRAKKAMVKLPLKKLTKQLIETSILECVYLDKEEKLELSGSWSSLITIMLMALYDIHSDSFYSILAKNNIISSGVEVYRGLIYKPLSSGDTYEIYKLGESGYYLSMSSSGVYRLQAIKGLLKSLGYDSKLIKFDIKPLEMGDSISSITDISLVIRQTSLEEMVLNISEYANISIVSISIFGSKQVVDSNILGLSMFLYWAKEVYADKFIQLAKASSNISVGVVGIQEVGRYEISFRTERLWGSDYLYIRDEMRYILKYIADICDGLGISKSLVEFEYKAYERT